MSTEYIFEADGKDNSVSKSNDLLMFKSLVRMRILCRWGLVLENEKDIKTLSSLKDVSYVSTGYDDIFSQSSITMPNGESKTSQPATVTSEPLMTEEKTITSSNETSYHTLLTKKNNNKAIPLTLNDFQYDTSFLPKIPNYKWVRRLIRDGFVYVYKKGKDADIKISEYSIDEGHLHLTVKDLIKENKEDKNANSSEIPKKTSSDPYWHSNTIDENDELGEYGFAYSECRWSVRYIEHLISNEDDRNKRFQKINTEEWYDVFKESISEGQNKFLQFEAQNKHLYSYFSLADRMDYTFQSGQQYNAWELLHFQPQIIDKNIKDDVKIMTNFYSQPSSTNLAMVLNVTLIDHLGAINDIIEDLTVSNALFNSLVETLGTPYSAYDKYEEHLEAFVNSNLKKDQQTSVSTKVADLFGDILPMDPSVEKKNSSSQGKDSSSLVQKKYSYSFKDSKRWAKVISYASKIIKSDTIQIKEEDARDLYISALLLYKILYSPDTSKIINSEDFRKTSLEQTNKKIEPAKSLQKYRDCVEKKKFEKILAVEERAELRYLILNVKNALGFFLTKQILLLDSELDDYAYNTESRKLDGKERFYSMIGVLTTNPRLVDKSLDIINEKEEKDYESVINQYDSFLVKCFRIPYMKTDEYKKSKLLQLLHTPISFDILKEEKSYKLEKDEDNIISASNSFCIILATQINIASHFEAQINKNLLDLSKEINYNLQDIESSKSDLSKEQKNAEESQQKHDNVKDSYDKATNNTKRQESLDRLEADYNNNVREIAKLGNDPVATLENKILELKDLEGIDPENVNDYNYKNKLINDIKADKVKVNQLEQLQAENKEIEQKRNKTETEINKRNKNIAEIKTILDKHYNNSLTAKENIESFKKDLMMRELHHENLQNSHAEMMQYKFKSKIIQFNEKIEGITNNNGFKTLSFVLSFTSFMRVKDDFAKNCRSSISVTGAFFDTTSIIIDLSVSCSKQIRGFAGVLGSRRGVAFIKGASCVSFWFGVVGTLAGTVISFMDMESSGRKGDNVSANLNAAAGVAGAISSASLIIIGVTGTNSVIIASMGIYGLLAMFIFTVLLMIFGSDDFEIFLRATVFSKINFNAAVHKKYIDSDRSQSYEHLMETHINDFERMTSAQLRYELCNNKISHCKNEGFYEEVYNSGFRVGSGEADPLKRKIDLKVFKNIIDYVYNLVVGFGAQVHVKNREFLDRAKEPKPYIYNEVIFTLFFNGYDPTMDEIDLNLFVYTSGIEKYMDCPQDREQQKYKEIQIKQSENILVYGENSPSKHVILGNGIKPTFYIADNIDEYLTTLPMTDINKNKICYILFFRFKMNNNVWWPFNINQSMDPVYVALSEGIDTDKKSVRKTIYQADRSSTYRHTISNQYVYIGTKLEILKYLKGLEKNI